MGYKDIEKQKLFGRIWKRNQREKYRKEIIEKLGGKCFDCGNNDIRILQIDHEEPLLRGNEKTHTGSVLVQEVKLGHVKKEDVRLRCANCHMIKTFNDRLKFKCYRG